MTRAFDLIEAVLFDIGSTLVSGPAVSPTKELARLFNLDGPPAAALARLIMCRDFDAPDAVCAAVEQSGLVVTAEQRLCIAKLWQEQECAALPIPGAAATVQAFVDAGKSVGLLSDIWAPYFHAVESVLPGVVAQAQPFLSFRCGMKKPELRFFKAAADGLGVPTSHIVMVGDSYREDIAPAIEAGMKTAWVLSRPERETASLVAVLRRQSPTPTWIVGSTPELLAAMQ